jgi:hypothetical protein
MFDPLRFQDFMDPNAYTSISTYQNFQAIKQDQDSPIHDNLTLHDFNAFMYSYLEPQYMVFNVKTICTTKSSLATLTKFSLHQNDLWHDDSIFQSLVTP